LRSLQADVRPSSQTCGAHDFPVRVGNAFAHLLINTLRYRFDEIVLEREFPPPGALEERGMKGAIFLRLDTFNPTISCPFAGSCIERTEVVLWVRFVDGQGRVLLNEGIRGEYEEKGGSIVECAKIAPHLDHSVSEALKEAAVNLLKRIGDVLAP